MIVPWALGRLGGSHATVRGGTVQYCVGLFFSPNAFWLTTPLSRESSQHAVLLPIPCMLYNFGSSLDV